MRSIRISQERERRKNLDTFEVPDSRMKLENGPQISGNLVSGLFSSFDVSPFLDRAVFDETARTVRTEGGLGPLCVSLSLSLMACCLVSSERMPVEAGCLQHAHGGLCGAGFVKSPSHQQADSALPRKLPPQRKTSLHTWYAQNTAPTPSACKFTLEESLGARGQRI